MQRVVPALRPPLAVDRLSPGVGELLTSPGAHSLIVRGAPGVGKTTLALGLLEAFPGARTFVSTRVPVESIRRQFGWVDGVRDPAIDFIEFVRFRTIQTTGTASIDHLRQTLQARASDLVDVSQVVNLPPVIQDPVVGAHGGPHLIVIDSWEAWVENILGSSAIALDAPTTRWELERAMLDELLATGANIVMVVEREERNRFDYLVDGSIVLRSGEPEGREERWVEVQKLRGVAVRNRSFSFTLENARFRPLQPTGSWAPLPGAAEPDPQPDAPSLWPGSRAFASQFGRLPMHGPVLLEVDPESPASQLWQLVAPIVESAVRSGGVALVRPPPSLDLRSTRSIVADVPAPALERLRLLAPPGTAPIEGAPRGMILAAEPAPSTGLPAVHDADGAAFDIVASLATRGGRGAHNLYVAFAAVPGGPPGSRGPDPFLVQAGAARRAGAEFASLVVVRSDDPDLNEVTFRAAVHLIARTRRGQLALAGVRPWSPWLAVRPPPSQAPNPAPFELVPLL